VRYFFLHGLKTPILTDIHDIVLNSQNIVLYGVANLNMPRKQAMTLDQRRALRTWAHRQSPRLSQKACIEWFQQQYSHRISQSTVSESLSSHFSTLDSTVATSARVRLSQWPELEAILLAWQIRIEQNGGVTSGELLREKARRIWTQLPQHSGQPCRDFSTRWLQRFNKRHNIQAHTQFGEAGSVVEGAEEEIKALQTLAREFQEEDIYNIDETGLY